MKNHALSTILLPMMLLLLAGGSIYANVATTTPKTPHLSISECPAPEPTWLVATDIQPTSIALSWQSSQLLIYFKLDAYDMTAGVGLPTQYVFSNPFYTWTGLTPGHTYKFDVSASYCQEGPFGPPTSLVSTTSIIIIDIVLELSRPCTPNNSVPTGANTIYNFCVQQSSSNNAPYTNGFVGRLDYDANNTLYFGVAAVNQLVRVGPVDDFGTPNSNFTFNDNSSHPEWVECSYLGTPIFRIDLLGYVPLPQAGTGWNNLKITFYDTFSGFSYCPAPNLPCNFGSGQRISGGNSGTQINDASKTFALSESSNIKFSSWLNPNPVRHTTNFRYESQTDGPVEIALYDAMGRLVKMVKKVEQESPGVHEELIEVAAFPAGVYFLRTQIGQHRETARLIKQGN